MPAWAIVCLALGGCEPLDDLAPRSGPDARGLPGGGRGRFDAGDPPTVEWVCALRPAPCRRPARVGAEPAQIAPLTR